MSVPLWFYDLGLFCLQLAILLLAGGLMATAARLSAPRVRLLYLRTLLAMGLVLPFVEPWRTVPQAAGDTVSGAAGLAQADSFRLAAGATHLGISVQALSWYQLVALLLFMGFLFRLLWLALSLFRLRRLRHDSCPLGAHSIVEELNSRLGLRPAVLVSPRLSSPAALGWHAPCVLLPTGFQEMDARRQRAILCHEFLHIRRRDWVWQGAEEILRAVFWFHPAVHWVISQMRLAREQAVDLEVVAYTGSRRDYLNALLEIASAEPRYVPAPLFLSERHLKHRVALILKEVHMSRKKMVLTLAASLGLLGLAGALSAALLPLQTYAAAQETAAGARENSGPVRWVNGPIRYIINPVERAEYERLTTGGQRQEFIRKFWERRNPNPSSATNAFKEEFYRRVAFANEHFATGSVPGWRTDRGRVYTMFGPPDEIDSQGHPGTTQPPYSYEVWTYKILPGIGRNVPLKFVDRSGQGNYRLTPESEQRININGPKIVKVPTAPIPPPPPPSPPPPPTLASGKQEGAPTKIRIGANVQSAKRVHYVMPVYPPVARKARIQGAVAFKAIIGKDGSVKQLIYVSGPPLLVQAAKEAIKQWKYKPTLLNGKPVEVETTITVKFTLGST